MTTNLKDSEAGEFRGIQGHPRFSREVNLPHSRGSRFLRQHAVVQADIAFQGMLAAYPIEQRTDLLISTLRGYVEAMGGKLHIVAEFPDRPAIELSGLATMDKEKEAAKER